MVHPDQNYIHLSFARYHVELNDVPILWDLVGTIHYIVICDQGRAIGYWQTMPSYATKIGLTSCKICMEQGVWLCPTRLSKCVPPIITIPSQSGVASTRVPRAALSS